MADLYLYDDVPVLRNSLGIKDENTLDRIEAEQSRANMMLLYERGFHDFTPSGLCEIHHFLFGDLYDWAGKYRIINIEKRERLLADRSVWYSNDEEIPNDLERTFSELYQPNWDSLTREQFVSAISRCFPHIWQVHPFREGNTRTVVMMMTFLSSSTAISWIRNCSPPVLVTSVILSSWHHWINYLNTSIWNESS